MNAVQYRGCFARVEYSDEDQSLVGRLAGIDDQEACEKLNRKPQRAAS